MSYDIGLQKIIDGVSGLCTPDEAQACIELLASKTSDKPNKFNFLVLDFDDGSSVELCVWEDESAISGCTFFTRGISQSILEFIFKMAVAGNFTILDTGGSDTLESPIAILTSEETLSRVGSDTFEHPKVCKDISELGEVLGVSSDKWIEYRDDVRANYSESSTIPSPKKKSFFKRLFSSKN